MKKTIILLLLLLVSCAQLQHGQMQPVITKSLKEKTYFTTCSGGGKTALTTMLGSTTNSTTIGKMCLTHLTTNTNT